MRDPQYIVTTCRVLLEHGNKLVGVLMEEVVGLGAQRRAAVRQGPVRGGEPGKISSLLPKHSELRLGDWGPRETRDKGTLKFLKAKTPSA